MNVIAKPSLTPAQRGLIYRARELLYSAPSEAEFEQLLEMFDGCTPADLPARLEEAEYLIRNARPHRRETAFRCTIRLLTAKGLSPTEIAREIGSTPGSVRVALHRMRRQDAAEQALSTATAPATLPERKRGKERDGR